MLQSNNNGQDITGIDGIDKENDILLRETPATRSKQNTLSSSKRSFTAVNTPLSKKTVLNTHHSHTPSLAKQHPILRDITNSAVTNRVNDVFPRSTPRHPLHSPKKSNGNAEPIVRSKLCLAEPSSNPEISIEALLVLPDDQLPDIDYCSNLPPKPESGDDFSDLPEIDESIFAGVNVSSEIDEFKESKKIKWSENERLLEALECLVIDPKDFEWAFDSSNLVVDKDIVGCLMFDDIPEEISCKV